MNKLLEELYAAPEVDAAFDQGRRYERTTHKCKTKVVIKEKKVFAGFRNHPRSKRRKYGVISNCQLLNPTFDTEVEAGVFVGKLVPANPANRESVKIDAQVVKLF